MIAEYKKMAGFMLMLIFDRYLQNMGKWGEREREREVTKYTLLKYVAKEKDFFVWVWVK